MIDLRVMKVFAGLVLVSIIGTIAQAQSVTNSDRLFFRNGDSLTGALESMTPDTVRWMRSDAAEPIEFASTNLTRLDLAPRRGAAESPLPECRVTLNNGDVLEGTLLSCDSAAIHLRSTCAGVIGIPRGVAKSVAFLPAPQAVIYEGPRGMEGWVQRQSALAAAAAEPGEWTYRAGAFYATQSASIARDFKLPDMARIEFDLRWQDRFQMFVALYTDSLQPVSLAAKENEPDFGGFYSFQLNNVYADVIAITKRDPLRSLQPAITPALSQTNRAHVDLRVNKRMSTITLLLNGVLVKQWVDTNGFVGRGTGLRFVNQAIGAVKLSNMRITPWDGRVGENAVFSSDGRRDAILKSDGSPIFGQVQTITNGMVAVVIPQTVVKVPLAQVTRLEFAGVVAAPVEPPGQVRVFAGGGSRLTLRIKQWNTNTVTGVGQPMGDVSLHTDSVTRVEW